MIKAFGAPIGDGQTGNSDCDKAIHLTPRGWCCRRWNGAPIAHQLRRRRELQTFSDASMPFQFFPKVVPKNPFLDAGVDVAQQSFLPVVPGMQDDLSSLERCPKPPERVRWH